MVQRYDCVLVEYDRAEMERDDTGEWVKYEDYERLQQMLRDAYDYLDMRELGNFDMGLYRRIEKELKK